MLTKGPKDPRAKPNLGVETHWAYLAELAAGVPVSRLVLLEVLMDQAAQLVAPVAQVAG